MYTRAVNKKELLIISASFCLFCCWERAFYIHLVFRPGSTPLRTVYASIRPRCSSAELLQQCRAARIAISSSRLRCSRMLRCNYESKQQ